MIFFLLALVILGSVIGDLLKAAGMRRNGAIADLHPRALGRLAAAIVSNQFIWLSIAAYSVSFFAFMALVSIADVSFAVPATAAAYVVETILAKHLLNEKVSTRRWCGALLVTCGVVMITL